MCDAIAGSSFAGESRSEDNRVLGMAETELGWADVGVTEPLVVAEPVVPGKATKPAVGFFGMFSGRRPTRQWCTGT